MRVVSLIAKSYQNYPQIGAPYSKGKNTYIKIQTPSGVREVRWYTEAQYEKLYGVKIDKIDDARQRFGFFPNDTLYIAHGTPEALTTFFSIETKHFGRYCVKWGWYVGVWAKEFNVELLKKYKSRMKELSITFYCLHYNKISDEKGSILPWEEMNGHF